MENISMIYIGDIYQANPTNEPKMIIVRCP